MSADRAGTAGQRTDPVVGVPRLVVLERGLRLAVLFTVAMLPLSEAAKNIGFGVSLALYLGLLVLHDRRWPAVPLVGVGLLGLLGATVLSALASEYPYNAASGVWEVFRHVSFFFITFRALRSEGDIRRFVVAIAAGTGGAALIFFYQFLLVGMPLFRFLSLGGENGSAQFLVMVLLLFLGVLAVAPGDRREHWGLAMTALILLVVLGVTEARTMWLAFVSMAVGMSLWSRRWSLAATGAGLVLIIVMVMTIRGDPVWERLGGLFMPGRGISTRIELWQKSLRIWKDHPWFGVGPRAFKVDEDVTKDPVRSRYGVAGAHGQAHNLWVHTAAEMGTVGLLGLLGWVAAVAISLWRLRGVPGDPWARALWVGTVGAFGAMMIAGVAEPAIGYEHSLLLNAELALLTGAGTPGCATNDPRRQIRADEEISR